MTEDKTRNELEVRSQKVDELRALGIEPYPSESIKGVDDIKDVWWLLDVERKLSNGEIDPDATALKVCGRVTFKRDSGKLIFMGLRDETGTIQLKVEKNLIEEEEGISFDIIKKYIDLGDFIGVKGVGCKTIKGELSVQVRSLQILSKAINPFPDSYYGVNDLELRRRHREIDLVSNPDSLSTFKQRSYVLKNIRTYLWNEGFMELETPILQNVYGGANARPFITHHNALDADLYLRIATELHLKRAVCGGMNKVFELGRVFRNEGIDSTHNPEFTSLEVYQAYADYFDMIALVEDLICYVVTIEQVHSSSNGVEIGTKLEYQGIQIDLERKHDYSNEYPTLQGLHWKVQTMLDAVMEHMGIDFSALDLNGALQCVREQELEGLSELDKQSWGHLLYGVFDKYVVPQLVQPTFIIDFPIEVSPLAKQHRTKEGFVERFELFIHGVEYSNGFSELNDPKEQRRRFEEQLRQRNLGDSEAQPLDEDYIHALSLGMPPCGGMGIGIDRLVMLLSNTASIRDVIMFPTMKAVE